MSDILRGRTFVVTKERARSMRPILRWVREGAPRKSERVTASKLLSSLEGIQDVRQVILSRDEAELYTFLLTEFPGGVGEEGRQLPLFELTSSPPARVIGRLPRPKPALKEILTEEEQDQREELGLPRLGRGQKGE